MLPYKASAAMRPHKESAAMHPYKESTAIRPYKEQAQRCVHTKSKRSDASIQKQGKVLINGVRWPYFLAPTPASPELQRSGVELS
ncbi:hypothetical protein DID76_02735 [Candidatus Marinamargulisbacteria bacterium SCGC AG-414-C22]|nr:hypothetical protein DID76_02735 [Candidatus Marinamargulisbacteria bacterium SCGC AG-414-C22]